MPFLTEQDYRYLMPLALYDFYVRKDIYEGPYTKMLLSTKVGRRFLVEQLFSEEEAAAQTTQEKETKAPKPKFEIEELNKTIEALTHAVDATMTKFKEDEETTKGLNQIRGMISNITEKKNEEDVMTGIGDIRAKISESLGGKARKELLLELDKRMKENGADKSIFYGILVKNGLLAKLWVAIKGSVGYLWKLAKKIFSPQTYSKMWNWAKGHKFWSISIIILFITMIVVGFGTSVGRKVLRFIWRIISWPFRMVYRGVKWVINKISGKGKVPSDVDTLEPSEIPEMA